MAEGSHPFPFRTRPLSPPAPMVLSGRPGGRVGRCRDFSFSSVPSLDGCSVGAFAFLAAFRSARSVRLPVCSVPLPRLDRTSSQTIPGLDGIRGLAILLVVL